MPDAAVPADDPKMIAWNKYNKTNDFVNTRGWAAFPQHVDGSLWAAFVAGFEAGAASSDERTKDTPE